MLRGLAWSIPATVTYLLGLPMLALSADRRLGLVWRLPAWADAGGWAAVVAGACVAIVAGLLLVVAGRGTPNPLAPPERLVTTGLYRRSRNPLMLGGWLLGVGMAIVLRSISLLALVAVIVIVGALYVRIIEEPRLIDRFGDQYRSYARITARWFVLLVALAGPIRVLAGGSVTAEPAVRVAEPTPAIMVQIRCKPGAVESWRRSFEQEILPSIQEAVARGDGFTGLTYYEAGLPAQPFHFVLVFEGGSFAQLDRRRPFPHYRVLFERLGPLRAQLVLKQMLEWEETASVTLVRRYEPVR